MQAKPALLLGVGLILALPAIAQQAGQPAEPAPAANAAAPATAPVPAAKPSGPGESSVEMVSPDKVKVVAAPAIEYPGWARRDVTDIGVLDPQSRGLGANPWGSADGGFLSTLMRRMRTPIASRWTQIALRDALLAKSPAPANVNPVDWVAERAWLLLRLGEADAARMLVSEIDTDQYTPKMTQVAVQAALATADPPALCGFEDKIKRHERNISQLVSAMCSSLAGEPENAAAQIDNARRYGRIGGIDLNLAEKVVGAGSNTGRSVTIEWEPVKNLTAWRFGLATATGMVLPDALVNDASARMRAFQARAPLLAPGDRLQSALVAAGLGVFSSQSMVDLMSAIYDSTDPTDLPTTEAWQMRQAFVAKTPADKVAAIRKLLDLGKDDLRQQGARAAAARAASLIEPSADFAKDAPDLIAAMLAGGYDKAAVRWTDVIGDMDDDTADRCWAMIALAAPEAVSMGLANRRLSGFVRRDETANKVRAGLLVAGLAGLGRISTSTANSYNRSNALGLGRETSWTRMIDAAARRRQPATVLLLTATGLQTSDPTQIPAVHLYHAIAALRATGQEYTARMIAAEALSRT
jgi:hypothetical protein